MNRAMIGAIIKGTSNCDVNIPAQTAVNMMRSHVNTAVEEAYAINAPTLIKAMDESIGLIPFVCPGKCHAEKVELAAPHAMTMTSMI